MFEVMLGVGTDRTAPGIFLGEVTTGDFITGAALASGVGVTEGTAVADTGWLKVYDTREEKTLYIPKKPIRYSISWSHLNLKGVVDGTKTIIINGNTYKVRLFSGANSSPSTAANSSYDHVGTHNCEWNRVMYHLSGKPFAYKGNTLASEGIEEGDWAQYTEIQLGMSSGNGRFQWCQELISSGGNPLGRGLYGVSSLGYDLPTAKGGYCGWRPVLELVE